LKESIHNNIDNNDNKWDAAAVSLVFRAGK
jgi:hypothetical protein